MFDDFRLGWHRGKRVLKYTEAGQSKRISLGTADEGLAEARARDVIARLTAAPTERIGDLWPIYVKSRLKDVERKDRFASDWKALAPHFAHRLGTAVNEDDCRDYYAARRTAGKSDSTIRTELEMLRACLRRTLGKEAPRIWLPPASKARTTWLTPEQVATIHAAAGSPHISLFIELAIATGARMSALLDLTWDRVDMDNGFIDLMPPGRNRTNKQRAVVPITRRAKKALEEARRGARTEHVIEFAGRPVRSVRKALERLKKRTGVPVSAHVLRHTAGVWMARRDVPMQKIAQYLGHSSTRVTERVYARYSPSFMQDAADALEW